MKKILNSLKNVFSILLVMFVLAGVLGAYPVNAEEQSTVSASVDEDNGKVDIMISEVPQVDQVLVPVWGDADGQNDIVWYEAQKLDDTTWRATVYLTNHKETGYYSAHVYTSADGALSLFGNTYFEITKIVEPVNLCSTEVNEDKGKVTITVSGVTQADKVQIPVWGDADGQNDIVWYEAVKQDSMTWKATVDLQNHKEIGSYSAHVYITANNEMSFFSNTVFNITKIVEPEKTCVAEVDESSGKVTITVSGVTQADKVQVPVWGDENGQNDIVWYEAVKQNGMTWQATVDLQNHKEIGSYSAHVYITSNNELSFFANTVFDITQIAEPETKCEAEVDESNCNAVITITGVQDADQVVVPVWGDTDGQNDVLWYPAQKKGDNVWEAKVSLLNHKETGVYQAHVYTIKNDEYSFFGNTQFNISEIVDSKPKYTAAIDKVLAAGNYNLRQCYLWIVNNCYYKRLPIPMDPPAGYTSEEGYAIYMMNNNRGDCYCFAATFAGAAKRLGYDATMIFGKARYARGSYGVHGWVEINLDGTAYICDPEFEYEARRNAYMVTYANAPTTYVR